MRTIALLAAITLTLGCQSETEKLQPWVGRHYSGLLGSWGAPEQVIYDGSGGKVLIYKEEHSFTSSTEIKKRRPGHVTIDEAQKYGYIKETVFRTNPKGVILTVAVNRKHF